MIEQAVSFLTSQTGVVALLVLVATSVGFAVKLWQNLLDARLKALQLEKEKLEAEKESLHSDKRRLEAEEKLLKLQKLQLEVAALREQNERLEKERESRVVEPTPNQIARFLEEHEGRFLRFLAERALQAEARQARITLEWLKRPRDLDLHLQILSPDGEVLVNYRTRGELTEFPWAQLENDVQGGLGPETIAVSRLLEVAYRCYVHNYSRDAPLTGSGARVQLELGNRRQIFRCPEEGGGEYWFVFELDGRTGEVREGDGLLSEMQWVS